MALPAGSRLTHLWMLPADCLLVEMSNGGLYAPGAEFLAIECECSNFDGAKVTPFQLPEASDVRRPPMHTT